MANQDSPDDVVMVDGGHNDDSQNESLKTPIVTESHSVLKNEDIVVQTDASVQKSQQQTITQLQKDLDDEREQRKELQRNLKAVTNKWKQLANELNKQRTADKPFHIITDDFLKEQVKGLRYDIRSFSVSHFDNLPPQLWPRSARHTHDLQQKRVMPHEYEHCAVSSTTVQSFIWRVLKVHMLQKYQWTTRVEVGELFFKLGSKLEPAVQINTQNASDLEALKKYHVWRAMTADMICKTEAASELQAIWEDTGTWFITQQIDPVISRFIGAPQPEQYHKQLLTIFTKALGLDREISRQAAEIRWVFNDLEGSAMAEASEGVRVVVEPGVTKRGKSSGEGFDETVQIVPPEIALVPELLVTEYNVEHRGSSARYAKYTATRDRPSGSN